MARKNIRGTIGSLPVGINKKESFRKNSNFLFFPQGG